MVASLTAAQVEVVAPPTPFNTKQNIPLSIEQPFKQPSPSPVKIVSSDPLPVSTPRTLPPKPVDPPQLPSSPYSPAHLSTTLLPQVTPAVGQLCQIVLPVEDLSSPGQFGVRLAINEDLLVRLLED